MFIAAMGLFNVRPCRLETTVTVDPSKLTKYDAIIIGSGQAGTPLVFKLAAEGQKVAFIEKEHFGGTCLNVGCTPTKAYVASARRMYEAQHGDELGVNIPNTDTLNIDAAFVGMISVGLAELQEYHLVARCKVPTPVAVATSVFVVVITVLFASIGHFYEFATGDNAVMNQVMNIIIFTIPGVIIGGQIGPRLQKSLPEDKMKIGIAILFVLVGIFMLYSLI